MMSKTSKLLYLTVTVIFFVIFNACVSDMILNNSNALIQNPILDIVFVSNQGAAFNIFDGYKIFLITFSLIAILGIIVYVTKHIQKIPAIGLFFISLLICVIFNNMAERIIFGFVRDYIKLNFIDFPVFNISDIFINIGVLGIIILLLKESYITKKN